ncbi:MAG: FtsX-like permease family protein [Planctomycetia bacterium]|nr:FtsX-like permease family protein [Planctomycetia bacterium]
MKLFYLLVLSRMKREKFRLLFILLAIAASSCLIVWTAGGYESLFKEAMNEEKDYMGIYNLKLMLNSAARRGGMRRGGGGGFSGPFARRSSEPAAQDNTPQERKNKAEKPSDPSAQRPLEWANPEKRNRPDPSKKKNTDSNSVPVPAPSGRGGQSIPDDLITAIAKDPGVILCDSNTTLRAFVYSKNMKRSGFSSTLEEKKEELAENHKISESESDVPAGIDPDLHRKGLAAYRAVMGTPMGMGSSFIGTTAADAPYNLEEGKWIRQNSENWEAVLTTDCAEKFNAKVGEDLLILTKTSEYQLKIVGIVDDSSFSGFYISMPLAEKIGGKPKVDLLSLKLRVSEEEFQSRWDSRLQNSAPYLHFVKEKDLARQKEMEAGEEENLFKYQAISGTLLAVLASIFIIFTALNMSVSEQKRQIAFYRTAGLTRAQIGLSILWEALFLAIPGWLGGIFTGWLLLYISRGSLMSVNKLMFVFSFLCAAVGAIVAAFYPMIQSMRVKPLDAINRTDSNLLRNSGGKKGILFFLFCFLLGGLFLFGDIWLVHFLPGRTEVKALLHSGMGMILLALGVLFLIPVLIRFTEKIFIPILAFVLHFDRRMLGAELSGNLGRTIMVALILSIGGGLFVSMQIWGYSMLGPFLPGRGMPERFAAFLPIGLNSENEEILKNTPGIRKDAFLPIAVEQAAFMEGSVPQKGGTMSPFANVVFLGADVDQGFGGKVPFIGMDYLQGNRKEAIAAMKDRRGAVITDSISVDYKLNKGDILRVVHPRNPKKILEYPIAGVVSFPGWQWLSKTGGVRRNFGRSGGIVFANEKDILKDYQIDRYSYFWFNTDGSRSYSEMEKDLDQLAQKNLRADLLSKGKNDSEDGKTAYVKISTRESLYQSIMSRADSVIWGLSKMPLITLFITSIAVIGAITNSVRARRWQFGIMRSVGITQGAIVRMILAEAILIGIVAALSSFLFGFLAAHGALKLGQSMFGTVDPPLIFPWKGLSLGFLLTLILCLCAAIWPAFSTGMKKPLDLLKEGRGMN